MQADGVDPNIPKEFGRSPLMEAYFHKNQDRVKESLESEAMILPKCTSEGADGQTFEPWFRKMLVNAIVNRKNGKGTKKMWMRFRTSSKQEGGEMRKSRECLKKIKTN